MPLLSLLDRTACAEGYHLHHEKWAVCSAPCKRSDNVQALAQRLGGARVQGPAASLPRRGGRQRGRAAAHHLEGNGPHTLQVRIPV